MEFKKPLKVMLVALKMAYVNNVTPSSFSPLRFSLFIE